MGAMAGMLGDFALIGRTEAVLVVDSPDDGGFYLEHLDRTTGAEKVSIIYPDRATAVARLRAGLVEWEGEG